MPYAKVNVHSMYNVNFNLTRYVEVDEEDLDENGDVHRLLYDEIVQDVIFEVVDAGIEAVVENEGD